MARATLPGNPPIHVALKSSARARRVSLRVSALDGRVTLTYPAGYPADAALDFARGKAPWIRRQLSDRAPAVRVGPGVSVPVGGVEIPVIAGPGRAARIEDGALLVPEERPGPAAAAFLRELARQRLHAEATRFAASLGRPFGGMTLRDTRSRWGSCSSRGDLMFSWRLVMAPAEVLSYVAAHEVAHLAHMNHSPRFWNAVETLFGPYSRERSWLRTQGAALHRFRFKD